MVAVIRLLDTTPGMTLTVTAALSCNRASMSEAEAITVRPTTAVRLPAGTGTTARDTGTLLRAAGKVRVGLLATTATAAITADRRRDSRRVAAIMADLRPDNRRAVAAAIMAGKAGRRRVADGRRRSRSAGRRRAVRRCRRLPIRVAVDTDRNAGRAVSLPVVERDIVRSEAVCIAVARSVEQFVVEPRKRPFRRQSERPFCLKATLNSN
jgi:hypothetical protein